MHRLILYLFKSETPLSLVLGGIRTYNLLIFGLIPKPSYFEAWQAFDLEGQVDTCLGTSILHPFMHE